MLIFGDACSLMIFLYLQTFKGIVSPFINAKALIMASELKCLYFLNLDLILNKCLW